MSNGGGMAVGPANRNIDATSLMWVFFRDHPLPAR